MGTLSNLPPGMSESDIPGFNSFEVTMDVTCIHCGHVEKDAEVVLDPGPRRYDDATGVHECKVCGLDTEVVREAIIDPPQQEEP